MNLLNNNNKYPYQDDYYEVSMPPYEYYYQYPMYTGMPFESQQPMVPSQPAIPTPPAPPRSEIGIDVPGLLPAEQSYIENILRLNLGKTATIYMTYENNKEWNAKIFKGTLEAAGRDHIIIKDPETQKRYLLLMLNLDYITFDEPLNYLPERIER